MRMWAIVFIAYFWRVKEFFLKIWPWLKNKYVLTISVFAIWMLFFDQNNVMDRVRMSSEIRQLEDDREFYLEQIKKDSARLHELTTDKENLEKYAREQFLMKKKDEDVFVIIEEKKWISFLVTRDSGFAAVTGDEWLFTTFDL